MSFRAEGSLCSPKMALISPWRKKFNYRNTFEHIGDALLKVQKRGKDAEQRRHASNATAKKRRSLKELIHINHKVCRKDSNERIKDF